MSRRPRKDAARKASLSLARAFARGARIALAAGRKADAERSERAARALLASLNCPTPNGKEC